MAFSSKDQILFQDLNETSNNKVQKMEVNENRAGGPKR